MNNLTRLCGCAETRCIRTIETKQKTFLWTELLRPPLEWHILLVLLGSIDQSVGIRWQGYSWGRRAPAMFAVSKDIETRIMPGLRVDRRFDRRLRVSFPARRTLVRRQRRRSSLGTPITSNEPISKSRWPGWSHCVDVGEHKWHGVRGRR